MKEIIRFTYLLKSSFRNISKDSIVNVDDKRFLVKSIENIVLLDESVGHPETVAIVCKGIEMD